MKTLFKNGKVYDGTGADAYIGDVLIEDDRIIAVGKDLHVLPRTPRPFAPAARVR